MLDRDFSALPDINTFTLAKTGLNLAVIEPGLMLQVNGDLNAALASAELDSILGWPEPAAGSSYAVRTGFDRMLVVGRSLPTGWQGRFGVTDASDALVTFEFSGPQQTQVLARLGEISLTQPSASAAFLVAGYRVIFYRHEAAFRLHLVRSHAYSFWDYMAAVLADLAS